MKIYDNINSSMNVSVQLKTIEIKWKLPKYSESDLQRIHSQSCMLIETEDIDNVLADMSELVPWNAVHHKWMRNSFLPYFEKLGVKRFAFIYPADIFASLKETIALESFQTLDFELKHFDNCKDANLWFEYYL